MEFMICNLVTLLY